VELGSKAGQVTEAFRLYLMDRISGHIVHVRELVVTEEARAIRAARRVQWRGPVELWSRDGKIMRREEPRNESGWLHPYLV
jgi:hypothetical protein